MINQIIAAALHDVHTARGDMFNIRSLRLTLNKVNRRLSSEGTSFLTKALPRLGKALDKALCLQAPLNATALRFKAMPGTELPILFGEFFKRILDAGGNVLPNPCVDSVQIVRQLTYLFYKYQLPYSDEQEQAVVSQFERTEDELDQYVRTHEAIDGYFRQPLFVHHRRGIAAYCPRRKRGRYCNAACVCARHTGDNPQQPREGGSTPPLSGRVVSDVDESLFLSLRPENWSRVCPARLLSVARKARHLLSDVFAFFDPQNIFPHHGPGAVATKQRLWDKYLWRNVAASITKYYPLDAYFLASGEQSYYTFQGFNALGEESLSAQVLLVPKDSRGPRLISCEPVDFQWVQQGLGDAIRKHVEKPDIFGSNKAYCQVNFTNQQANQIGALMGSRNGKYATLDLKEASDRVTVSLVRLLFPPHISEFLEACRSLSTQLPDGRVIKLKKFAPMGSSLCFPVMALTVWAILAAGVEDTDARESILVYGDDVIVPTAYAVDAIELLESFGLKVNHDKSCIKGFFRESCGVDAFQGFNVTPIKLKSVWSSSRSADEFEAYVDYSNAFFERGYYITSELIARELVRKYGTIPGTDARLECPSLHAVTDNTSLRWRTNLALQRREALCTVIKTPGIEHDMYGYAKLLRWFAEKGNPRQGQLPAEELYGGSLAAGEPFSVSTYTKRDTAVLRKKWVSQACSREIPRTPLTPLGLRYIQAG